MVKRGPRTILVLGLTGSDPLIPARDLHLGFGNGYTSHDFDWNILAGYWFGTTFYIYPSGDPDLKPAGFEHPDTSIWEQIKDSLIVQARVRAHE